MTSTDKAFLLAVIVLMAIAIHSITIFMTHNTYAFDYNNKTASNATPSELAAASEIRQLINRLPIICEENPSECQFANQTTPLVNQTPVQNSAQEPTTTNLTNSTKQTGTPSLSSQPSYAKLLQDPQSWNRLSDVERKQVEQLQYKVNYTHVTLSNGTVLHQLPDTDLIVQVISNTDWSGNYGNSSGSTTVDGHGNQDILVRGAYLNDFSVSFQKKTENGILTVNIIGVVREGIPLMTKDFEIPEIVNSRTTTAAFGLVSLTTS